MKINELIKSFTIYTTNEEACFLDKIDKPYLMSRFDDREQVLIQNLVNKSLLSKVTKDGFTYVIKNSE